MSVPGAGLPPSVTPALPATELSTTAALSPSFRDPLGWLLVLTVVLRAAAFPFTENLFGDAVVRTELAERWLTAPKLITSFNDGVYQFGPLHTYVVAAFLAVWKNRESAGRLASLVFGVLTVIPLYRLTFRQFGRSAAIWAGLGFAFWGMHIQASTTAGSEALGLWVFAMAVEALLDGQEMKQLGPLVRSALYLNLACAVRYDAWMYIPLFVAAILLGPGDRIARATRAVLFGGLACIFPLWWMQGNERAMGDPLYPIHYIDHFHANWTKEGIAWLGEWRMRAWGSVFWPGTVLVTLSPLLGLLSFGGIARAFVEKRHRTLAVFAVVPTVYYTFRASVLLNFSPLARFAIIQVFLCLPYAWSGFDWLTRSWGSSSRWALAVATALVALVMPASIGVLSFHADDGWGHTLKPVSPVSTMPQIQMTVAHWLRDHVAPDQTLIVDWDDAYTDIGVAFFSNIPEEHLQRARWEDFSKRAAQTPARYAVLFKNGRLGKGEGVRDAPGARIAGRHYHPIQSFQGSDFEVFELDPG